jgi:hypothetical protein
MALDRRRAFPVIGHGMKNKPRAFGNGSQVLVSCNLAKADYADIDYVSEVVQGSTIPQPFCPGFGRQQ